MRDYFDSGRAVVHCVETKDDLSTAFEILIDLHQKRRRSLSQAGCFTSRRFTEFHREISARLLDDGRLRMNWIELDARPMSVEYALSGGGIVYYYQGGFEPELSADGPGWISNAMALKLAVDDGYRGYDFLRGNESYKASWGAEARLLVRWRVAGRQPSARARWAAWRAATDVNRWARRIVSQATE
jgi:CelD/BcsL family acetyltransferase involved in cellulose biosynthesis